MPKGRQHSKFSKRYLDVCADELVAVELEEGEAALLAQFLVPAAADDARVGQHQLLPLIFEKRTAE